MLLLPRKLAVSNTRMQVDEARLDAAIEEARREVGELAQCREQLEGLANGALVKLKASRSEIK